MINSFRDEYFFLSNFYEADVEYKGLVYKNNEAAFQAQKVLDDEVKCSFCDLNPSMAKRKGRRVALLSDWNDLKFDIMYEICLAKFSQHEDLKQKLLDTKDKHLEEGNNWGDRIWGTVNGKGQTHLGKILMRVREELNQE